MIEDTEITQTKAAHPWTENAASKSLRTNDNKSTVLRKDFARRQLDRNSLPAPANYLHERGLLARAPRGEWVSITCPIHAGGAERNPSLRVSLVNGNFKCMACGEKGGDVIALHRLITGASFMEAVLDLGGRFDG